MECEFWCDPIPSIWSLWGIMNARHLATIRSLSVAKLARDPPQLPFYYLICRNCSSYVVDEWDEPWMSVTIVSVPSHHDQVVDGMETTALWFETGVMGCKLACAWLIWCDEIRNGSMHVLSKKTADTSLSLSLSLSFPPLPSSYCFSIQPVENQTGWCCCLLLKASSWRGVVVSKWRD